MEANAAELPVKKLERGPVLLTSSKSRMNYRGAVYIAMSDSLATRVGGDGWSQGCSGMTRIVRKDTLGCHRRYLTSNHVGTRFAFLAHGRPDIARIFAGVKKLALSLRTGQLLTYLVARSFTRRPLKIRLPSSSPESSETLTWNFSLETCAFSSIARRKSRYREPA